MVGRLTAIFLIFVCFDFRSALAQSVLLGVLEDNPGHYFGNPNFRAVRVAFKKNGSAWQPFRSGCTDQACLKTVTSDYPREVEWTIAFDGKNVGRVAARTPKEFEWYASVGQQEIRSTTPVPAIGRRSAEYSGFLGQPVYRPLVAISQSYLRDPDSWKPAQLPPDVIRLFRQQFRQKFPKVCRMSKKDETKLEPLPYRDENVEAVKVYRSNKEWVVVQLRLSEAIDCNDETGSGIDDPWFVSDPQHSVRYLDAGLWLVDAGDYDNDGKSELLFSISRENRGGYELFYDDFRKHVSFEYSYH